MELPYLAFPFFLVIAFIYGSVGMGGATGYLALLSLFGLMSPEIVPVVLSLNVIVAGNSLLNYSWRGYFRFELIWPFIITSLPAALLAGMLPVNQAVFQLILGVVLFIAGTRLLFWPKVTGKETDTGGRDKLFVKLIIGFLLGGLAGLTGTGGGFLLAPVLLLYFKAPAKETACTLAAFITFNSISGIIGHLAWLNFPVLTTLKLVGLVLAGGISGAWLGAGYFKPRYIRRIIAAILFLGGLKLLTSFLG